LDASLQLQNSDVTDCAPSDPEKRAGQKRRTASPSHRLRASSNGIATKLVIGNYSSNIILGQLTQHTKPYRSSQTLQSDFHSMEQKIPTTPPPPPNL
jgi:hypothetical protein